MVVTLRLLYPQGKVACIRWEGGWLERKALLDSVVNIKITSPVVEYIQVAQLVASHFTEISRLISKYITFIYYGCFLGNFKPTDYVLYRLIMSVKIMRHVNNTLQ